MPSPPRSALVVEDDPHIGELICLHLGLEGFDCQQAVTGPDGLAKIGGRAFDLIILDVMLPGVDGITICRSLRRSGPNMTTPVLMVTARREESDTVLGLDSGADDYLAKPFGVRELVARVHALVRRGKGTADEGHEPPLSLHGLDLDPSRRLVKVRGTPVEMTKQEFGLLYALASHPGIVFSRERLLAKVWQGEAFVTARSVDTLVKRVRRKIEADPAAPQLIYTVWGDGYKFADA